jgi:tRNA threonylcarbamoyl adenosine modification protein (Sua5/YciO/YrdC/YwlC family)
MAAASILVIHPSHPQPRLVGQAAKLLAGGGVIAYPTDSSYALGCLLDNAAGARRIRDFRHLDERHELTVMCRDLADVGRVARLDNWQFRIVRSGAPGRFTFLVPASREVPRRALRVRRSTVGVRISPHPVVAALLEATGGPMLTSTLQLAGDATPLADAQGIRHRVGGLLDLILDAGTCSNMPTTVIDLSDKAPVVVREGAGDIASLAVEAGSARPPVA